MASFRVLYVFVVLEVCQATDQGQHLLADPRLAPALSGSPAPVEAKAGSMPPDDGLRFHDEQHV